MGDSNAVRVERWRERMKAEGFVPRTVWIHKDDLNEAYCFLRDLQSKRRMKMQNED